MNEENFKPKHLLVDYGRRSYAFGLPWFTADEEEPTRKQAVAFIKGIDSNFDLLAERKGEYPQYTIAASEEGMRAGAISAASIVAEMVPTEDWLYVAEIEEAIWITYGRDGLIMPDGDKIYTDVEEAKAAFEELNPTRWKTLSIPGSWQKEMFHRKDDQDALITSDIEESSLQDIFQSPSKLTARLQAVSNTATLLKAFLGISALAVVGYFGYQAFFPEPEGPTPAQIQQQQQMIIEQQRQDKERIFAELDANKPWILQPRSIQAMDTCLAEILDMPLEPAGYGMMATECRPGVDGNPTNVVGSYNRQESYPSWLREWSLTNPDFRVDIDLETSGGIITHTAETHTPRGPEELTDYRTMQQFLVETDLLIEGGMTYTQPIQYTYDEYPDYIPLYGTSDLRIATPQPEQWKLALSNVPGVVINRIQMDVNSMEYIIEGQIYVSTR